MLRRVRLYIIYIIGVLMICTACERTEEVSLDIPISICLPVSSVQANAPMRRVPGDPGGAEQFLLPRYAYIFILQKKEEVWKVINVSQETLDAEDWLKTRYAGYLNTEGDSIYKYSKIMHLLLEKKGVQGRVYGIASYESLTFNKEFNTINDLDDLLQLKFNSHDIQGSLQHIYSTPYNYILAGTGEYYCAFDNTFSNVEYVNLLLYHVAAKVDIKWSVPEDKRIDREIPDNGIRLTYMKAVNLFDGYAYCFRPMEDTVTSMLTAGHSIVINDNNEGLWWEGRDYFYTIPYIVEDSPDYFYFPLQMKLCTNGTAPANAYKATLNLHIDHTSPFVPWLRADFNINSKLAPNGSSTKDVNWQ